MKSLIFFILFIFTVLTSQAATQPVDKSDTLELNTATTELVISTKGIKKLEDINVIDFHKNTYIKLMLRVKRASKIC